MESEPPVETPYRFPGFREEDFRVFAIAERVARRRAILDAFHPPLRLLAEDLLERLGPKCAAPLHAHLPRLDWPAGYQPFCTWLALSREKHGYQAGPQINVGVHADHVAIRLGWDPAADAFGRFRFLCLHAGLGPTFVTAAEKLALRFRVYAAASWPEGSRRVFEAESDIHGAFRAVARSGVWFELGARHDLPESLPLVTTPALARRAVEVAVGLLPLYERITG